MDETQRADAEASPPDLDALADSIRKLLRAVRTVRQAGGTVRLPQRLVQACRELIDEADGSSDIVAAAAAARTGFENSQSAMGDALREIPLRRLLWQVITTGETFTVSTVANRLSAALGIEIEPAKVSNALGYWVSRNRLVRERKGVYSYPAGILNADTLKNAKALDYTLTTGAPSPPTIV